MFIEGRRSDPPTPRPCIMKGWRVFLLWLSIAILNSWNYCSFRFFCMATSPRHQSVLFLFDSDPHWFPVIQWLTFFSPGELHDQSTYVTVEKKWKYSAQPSSLDWIIHVRSRMEKLPLDRGCWWRLGRVENCNLKALGRVLFL